MWPDVVQPRLPERQRIARAAVSSPHGSPPRGTLGHCGREDGVRNCGVDGEKEKELSFEPTRFHFVVQLVLVSSLISALCFDGS